MLFDTAHTRDGGCSPNYCFWFSQDWQPQGEIRCDDVSMVWALWASANENGLMVY